MAIVRTEAYFNSSNGINKIRTLIWKDDELTPRGVFQIAHGMAEHIGRYDEFAKYIASNGFVVCGNDHLGHGKSVNDISELGFIAEKNGDKRLVDDMHILTKIMKKRYPDLPYFLFGHSMGSFCARVYTAHFGDELNGAVFCGTGELPAVAAALQEPINKLCEKLGPHTKYEIMGSAMNAFFNVMVPDKTSPLSWISANADNIEAYKDDPLCGFIFTLGGYRDLFAIANDASRKEWASEVPLDLPILIISGALDPVGLNGKGVMAVSDNLVLAGKEPTVVLYPGDRHEILMESDKDVVYHDVLAWLDSQYVAK